jgi:hypothetical protein
MVMRKVENQNKVACYGALFGDITILLLANVSATEGK